MRSGPIILGWFLLGLLYPFQHASGQKATDSAPLFLNAQRQDEFRILAIDTLLYVENRGLKKIFVDLNGHSFKLVTDPQEVQQSTNAFHIPEQGEITINIATYIYSGSDNIIGFEVVGPAEADAKVVIGDLLLPGQQVAYAVEGLEELPETFALLENYPNPVRDGTTISYRIPENWTNGRPVRLAIYDLQGREVRVLVEGVRFPGTFRVEWDTGDASGRPVPSGIYLYRLLAGGQQQASSLVVLR